MQNRVIFVVGNSRSGTTMMGKILGQHSQIHTFDEIHFFEELWDPNARAGELSTDDAVELGAKLLTIARDGYFTQAPASVYRDEASNMLEDASASTPPDVYDAFLAYETQRHGKTIPCDHTPRNLYYLEMILKLYPDARVIHLIRDPRDVVLSQKRKWRRRGLGAQRIPLGEAIRAWANYHPITISLLWNSAVRTVDRYSEHPQFYHLTFEELVHNSESYVREICKFVDLAFEPHMLSVPIEGSSYERDRPILRGINASASERWRKVTSGRADVAICEKLCRDVMVSHGYEISGARISMFTWMWVYLTWPFKSLMAFVMNIGRVKSAARAIRRRLMGIRPTR